MNTLQKDASVRSENPPRNGLAGLHHWRHDLLAGFVVSVVSLPLSSGIAIASGAPPIYGILSSIVAGLVFPFVGGSFVTISGPAAGLAPALMATMVALGGAGDAETVGAGYPLLLVVIFFAGLLQVGMARLNLARFASLFPACAVEGMLGAIGLLILVKALPLTFGYVEPVHAHGFVEYLREAPHFLAAGTPAATLVGLATLLVMGATSSAAFRAWAPRLGKVPPHLYGVALAVPLATTLGLGATEPRLLVQVPADPLSGLSLPAFGALWASTDLWWPAFVGMVTLMLIDGVESLATARAIDRIDPWRRHSDPDRVLLAMGLSNMVSSLVGGLTVIPGGVKSKTAIEAGGRTLWANFVNAVFLLVFLFVAPGLLGLLPKAALGAILVYTGLKMAHPAIARRLAGVGREQVAVYAFTIAAILVTDLLVGLLLGALLKFGVVLFRIASVRAVGPQDALDLFRNPVTERLARDGATVLIVERPVVSFNSYRLFEQIARERADGAEVTIVVGRATSLIDHTSMEALHELEEDGTVGIVGLEELPSVHDPLGMRIARA